MFGYDVYEGTSSDAVSTLVTDSPVPGTSYTVSGLTSGVTYYFDVTAVSKAGASGPSSEASATTGLPGPPTGLAALSSGVSQVGLSWTAPVSWMAVCRCSAMTFMRGPARMPCRRW